jgi:hypothetical protein
MLCLKMSDVKNVMSKLLVQTVFDNFLVSELDVATFCTLHINGKINKSWYDTGELETSEEYSKWSQIKPYAYQVIKGSKVPASMKLVFFLSGENKTRLIQRAGGDWKEHDISQFCLNMKYENGEMYITTGVAYRIFTMDHTMQEQWDYDLKKFLKYYQIEYEEVS